MPKTKNNQQRVSRSVRLGQSRGGHLILRALAIRVSNPKNALAQISFHSPKSLPPPHRDHAVATARQLAILPKTSSSCSSCTSLNHGQLSGFFAFFSSSTTFGTPEIYFHIFKLTRGTRTDQKQFASNVVKQVVDRGLLLQKNKILV